MRSCLRTGRNPARLETTERDRVAGRPLARTLAGITILVSLVGWPIRLIGGDGPGAESLADLRALEETFVKLADKVRPSVVAIQTYRRVEREGPEEGTPVRVKLSQGSGLIIDEAGLILTNRHVLEDADAFAVILFNGDRFEATVQQSDIRSDLAVLKIDASGLKAASWGDSGRIRVGQWVFAAGNPFGLANTTGDASVTFGTISALGRDMTDRLSTDALVQYYGNLIETTSTINPGNSGGPLFNLNGEVIGVVTAIATRSGVSEGSGFAIPIESNARRIIECLRKGEVVRYGYLGVTVTETDPPMISRSAKVEGVRGLLITALHENGPAAQAGLAPNDVLVEFNGVALSEPSDLVRLVSFTPVGTEVELTYLRQRVKRKTTLKVGDRLESLGLVQGG